jgi:hypothetical protein
MRKLTNELYVLYDADILYYVVESKSLGVVFVNMPLRTWGNQERQNKSRRQRCSRRSRKWCQNGSRPAGVFKGLAPGAYKSAAARPAAARSGVSRGRFTTPADTNKRLRYSCCLRPRSQTPPHSASWTPQLRLGRPLGLSTYFDSLAVRTLLSIIC